MSMRRWENTVVGRVSSPAKKCWIKQSPFNKKAQRGEAVVERVAAIEEGRGGGIANQEGFEKVMRAERGCSYGEGAATQNGRGAVCIKKKLRPEDVHVARSV